MARPVIGVLALQGDVAEHVGMLEAAGATPRPVRRATELSDVDGLVLPGGESTTVSRLLESFELVEPLRARIADGLPVFGSCAGMILLAGQVLDGSGDQHQLNGLDVLVRRNAFGRQVNSFEQDLDFRGIAGSPVRAVFIRAPWVEKTGPNVEVLARLPETPETGDAGTKIVAVRQGPVLATAFHPELAGDARVHEMFVGLVRET